MTTVEPKNCRRSDFWTFGRRDVSNLCEEPKEDEKSSPAEQEVERMDARASFEWLGPLMQ